MSLNITNQSNLNTSYNDRWNPEMSYNYSRRVRERSRSRERYSTTRYHSSSDAEEERINLEILKKKQELANILKETNSYNNPLDQYQTNLSTSDINIERLLQEAVYSGSKIPSPPPPPPPPPQIQSYQYHESIPKITIVKCDNAVINSRKFFFDRIDKLLKNNKDGLINGSNFPRSAWPLKRDGSVYLKLNDIAYDFNIKYRIITGTFYFDFTAK